MTPLRVKAYTKKGPAPRGYVGEDEVYVQELQIWVMGGWRTIDQEEVPAHVRISLGAFGDNGGWRSKFAKFGRFGRDGAIQP